MKRNLLLATTLAGLVGLAGTRALGQAPAAAIARPPPTKVFKLFVNPAFAACLEKTSGVPPIAVVAVTEGNLNDALEIAVTGLKPNLKFDLFTVEKSSLDAHGSPLAPPADFGLAWYQTDLDADANGNAAASIRTILVNQIFGFDPDVKLAPTNTFHVGFWFNSPDDAAPCGFTGSTPFNGEHNAGPLAMITVPDASTGLGPLCFNPNKSTPGSCNP